MSSQSADNSAGGPDERSAVSDQGVELSLYQTGFCPYCVRVRHAIEELRAEVEVRDVAEDSERFLELVRATGRQTVPVLRIEAVDGSVEWLPESADIIAYLQEHFRDA